MQLKEGGALAGRRGRRGHDGPGERQARADARPSRWARTARVHLTDDALAGSDVNGTGYALAKVLEAEAPDLVLLGQQSDDGECYTIGAVVADHLQMPSLTQVIKIDVEDGALRCERQAEYGYDTVSVELPAVISRRRRDQRAALPVAEGDHGRQEEAAGDQVGRRRRASRPTASATTTPARTAATSPPRRPSPRARSSRTRTPTRRSRRSSRGWTRGSCWHERGSWSTRCTTTARSTRTRSARSPRARGWRPSSAPSATRSSSARASPTSWPSQLGNYGASEGLPRRGPRGPGAAGRRRDGGGDRGQRPRLRAVRRRPARLRDRRRPGRAPGRRRLHGGHQRPRRGRQARRRAPDPAATRRSRSVHYRSKVGVIIGRLNAFEIKETGGTRHGRGPRRRVQGRTR